MVNKLTAQKIRVITCAIVMLSSIITNAQSKSYSPPGKLIDIGGYNLHLMIEGENQNGPTVVFFHGAGDIALNWNLVLPQVGKFATSVAIDQAGEGWSDHGRGASLFQQVYDSHEALKRAGYNAPYILVGQSLGGILANIFASKYPEEVIGLVMVDAAHHDILLNVYNKKTEGFEWKIFRTTANDDIPIVVKTPLKSIPETSSFKPRKDFGDMLNKFTDYDKKLFNWVYNERPWTYVKGFHNYEAEIFNHMFMNKEKYKLNDTPLIVITGGKKEYSEDDKIWTSERKKTYSDSLQRDLLNLSTKSKQIIANNSGHQIHIDEPEIVVMAIKQLIQEIKSNQD